MAAAGAGAGAGGGMSMNGWAAAFNLASGVLGALGNAYAAKAQAQQNKFMYQQKALTAQFQADVGRLNAQIAAYEGTRKQIAFAQQAAVKGLQAGQAMANTRVQQSASGVRMDSTSSQQVRASQRFSRAVDMATTEQNRIELLNQSQSQVTSYLAQSNLYEANANTNNMMASAISPSSAFNTALATGLFKVATEQAPGLFDETEEGLDEINLISQKKAQGFGIDQGGGLGLGFGNSMGNNFGGGLTI